MLKSSCLEELIRGQKEHFSQNMMYVTLTLYLFHGGILHFSGWSTYMMEDPLILLFERDPSMCPISLGCFLC